MVALRHTFGVAAMRSINGSGVQRSELATPQEGRHTDIGTTLHRSNTENVLVVPPFLI